MVHYERQILVDRDTGRNVNYAPQVYTSMVLTVLKFYTTGIGDYRSLTVPEIIMFYAGIEKELTTRPPEKK